MERMSSSSWCRRSTIFSSLPFFAALVLCFIYFRSKQQLSPLYPTHKTDNFVLDHDIDYFSRLSFAYAHGRFPPADRFLSWLHVPKTGTSFVNTLLHWGCPSAPNASMFVAPRKERPALLYHHLSYSPTSSWDWLSTTSSGRAWLRRHCPHRLSRAYLSHNPAYALNMHRPLRPADVSFSVALFRLPLQRLYSNYLHLSYHYNETRLCRPPNRTIQAFISQPQFVAQQTKLILGFNYRHKHPLSLMEAHRAADIVVNRLPFVGLTENFGLSVRLFHTLFGGVPRRSQFENVRPSILRYQSPEMRSSAFRYDPSIFGGWQDRVDDIVYSAAHYRFWRDVCRLAADIELDGLGPVFSPLCFTLLFSIPLQNCRSS